MSAKRSWTGRAAAAAMAVGLTLATSVAMAAPAADQVDSVIVPSAKSLLRFYPTQLSSTPSGTVEDQDVWLAKVQGLMAGAPSLLQQSILMSQTKQEFSANVTLLQQLQKGVLEQSTLDLRSQAKAGMMTKSLGDQSNLIYKPFEPCRIMDTRNASLASGVQGPIAGGSLKHIPGTIVGNWGTYGGSGTSDCGLNTGAIWATALVITIPAEGGRPNFDAFLGVGDVNNLNTTLSTVAVNFTHGQGISTLYIVPQTNLTIYFAMPTGLSANIIFDVVGVFEVSDATALQCLYPLATGVGTGNFTNGTLFGLSLPACASGYTLTGSGCSNDYVGAVTLLNEVSPSNFLDCIWQNTSGGTLDKNAFHSESVCCRVPGK